MAQPLPDERPHSKTLADVVSHLHEMGLSEPSRPDPFAAELEYPSDVSNISTDELGRLLGVYSDALAYVEYQVAVWDTERIARKNRLEFAKAKRYIQARDGGKSVEDCRQAVRADPEIARLQRDYDVAAGVWRLTDAILSGLARKYAGLSRELTRRGISDLPQYGRRLQLHGGEEDEDDA
jgi:hypothetical protein